MQNLISLITMSLKCVSKLSVIPAKLAIASTSRNPGISKGFWIPGFAGMRGGTDLFQ
jgi:hypothetical protein